MIDLAQRTSTPVGPEMFSVCGGDLKRAIKEYGLQTTVIKIQSAKTVYAMQQLSELHEYGALSKKTTLEFLVALDQTVTFPDPMKQIWAESLREQTLMYVDQMHKLLRIGAKNIAIEVDRTLYLPELPPHNPGLFVRILRAITGGPS